MLKKRIHVVPHMHWDREWYFSAEESQILLVNNMEEIMEMLENNQDYPAYILDGQSAILEDYFQVKPANKQRVKKLVQDGRLIIGPWVSQTDEMVVGGESILRNLLYGHKDCIEFGQPMAIGYLPDSFGQSSQMPMILNQFDIKYSIFWRGVSERHGVDKTEFYWQSKDGSKVLVQLLPLGYAIGKYLPTDELELKSRMDKYFQVLDKGATGITELIPNGHDQMPIQQNIFEVLSILRKLYPEREFLLSTYENVFAEIEKHDNLTTIQGEFLDGKYSRVHRSIFATRQDLKILNTKIENKITNILEPLASIAYALGFSYEHGLIEVIWKLLLKNHAHDSMAACCSDKVHREITARYLEAEERCDCLIEFYKRKIIEATPNRNNKDKLGIFNLLPYESNRLICTTITTRMQGFKLVDVSGNNVEYSLRNITELDPGLIDRQIVHYGNYEPFFKYEIELTRKLPACGYEVLFIEEQSSRKITSQKVSTIDTSFYNITPNINGTVNIFDKNSKKQYQNVFSLDDTADDGDEYDFSPIKDEQPISSLGAHADVQIIEFEHEFILTSTYVFEIPKSLSQSGSRSLENIGIPVALTLTIAKLSAVICVKLEVNNKAYDHRLRLLIPTNIASKTSFASNQFGIIERAVYDEALNYWQKEQWDERPDNIYPFLGYVALTDESLATGVLTNSSREYEIIGEKYDIIAITVLRSVGVLGKEALLRRPGRPSGIKLLTPMSQMLGKITLNLALTFAKSLSEIAQHEQEFNTSVETYNQIPYNAMKLNKSIQVTPYLFSLFELVNKNLILSAVKKAENSQEILVRFFNPTENIEKLTIKNYNITTLYSAKELIVSENFNGEVKPNQVITIAI